MHYLQLTQSNYTAGTKKKKKKSQKAATYNSNPNSLLTFGVRIFESPVSLIKEKTRPVV